MVKIYIYNEMKKQNIPEEIFTLITEEEIIMFQELQIKTKELNNKTNLTRLINGNDYWISQVFDSIWPFKTLVLFLLIDFSFSLSSYIFLKLLLFKFS